MDGIQFYVVQNDQIKCLNTIKNERPSDEGQEMSFAAFSAGAGGTHFVTSTGQPITKMLHHTVTSNGNPMPQVVSVMGGVNEMQMPQIISLPISLGGETKPGEPQPTVQIQVLNPNMIQQQHPKYHMQIPIQGLPQGAVLTVAYSPEMAESGGAVILPEGLQVLSAMPQEVQMLQQTEDNKDQVQQALQQQQVFITQQNHQIVINGDADKLVNNNTTTDNNNSTLDLNDVVIKEEDCEDNDNDESSQGLDSSNASFQLSNSQQELIKYLNTLPPQQAQQLPASLQQFLRLNPAELKKTEEEMEYTADVEKKQNVHEAIAISLDPDGTIRLQTKKKKKPPCKRKPPRPARPKPGQVTIATAADGTPIFCCPECQMAFTVKEQLEMHLSVHKIERRFICGICGAGLKRKEHLERHKLGHNPERPYVCGVCCKGFKRREHLNLHTVIHSGVKTEMCLECGKGFYRKDHLRKHTRSHESKRLKDEANGVTQSATNPHGNEAASNLPAEITIHVPTSENTEVPIQINIPPHMVSSLQSQPSTDHDDDSSVTTSLDDILS